MYLSTHPHWTSQFGKYWDVSYLSLNPTLGSALCKLLGIIREWATPPSAFGKKSLSFSDLTPHSGSIHLPHPLLSSLSTQLPLSLLLEEAVLTPPTAV